MYCWNCGSELAEGSAFCARCGAKVAPSVQAPAQTPAPATSSAPSTPADATPEAAPTHAAPGTTAAVTVPNAPKHTAPGTSKPKKRGLIIGIVLALIVIAAATVAWLLINRPSGTTIDETNFPDEAVRTAVSTSVDLDGDGSISQQESDSAVELTIDGPSVVVGLGTSMPNLTYVKVTGSNPSTVDVSDLPVLEKVDVSDSGVTEINIGGCPKLREIDAKGSDVSSIDVSKNPELSTIEVDDTTELDGTNEIGLSQVWLCTAVEESLGGDPIGKVEANYNEDGSVASQSEFYSDGQGGFTLAKGLAYNYENGHVVSATAEGTRAGTQPISYSYDDQGRLSRIDDDCGGSTSYTYDDKDRVKTMTVVEKTKYDTSSSAVRYSYEFNYSDENDFGADKNYMTLTFKVKSSRISSEEIYTYSYDDAGRCIEITPVDNGGGGLVGNFAYDDEGRITSSWCERTNGETDADSSSTLSCTYDEESRLQTVTYSSANNIASLYTLSYDDAGRLASVVKSYPSSTETASVTWTLNYGQRMLVPAGTDEPEQAVGVKLYPSLSDGMSSIWPIEKYLAKFDRPDSPIPYSASDMAYSQ